MERKPPFKGDKFYTRNPMGIIVQCEYLRHIELQGDCHAVQLLEGEYHGVAYKSLEELLPKKPIQ